MSFCTKVSCIFLSSANPVENGAKRAFQTEKERKVHLEEF